MQNNKINKYHEWAATQANNYFPKGTVTAVMGEDTNDPCLMIKLDQYEPKIIVSISSVLCELTEGVRTETSCLTEVLKITEQAAARIPNLTKDTYFAKITE